MFRWDNVDDTRILGMTVKMYRKPYEAARVQTAPGENLELDHYAFKYLDSEIYMYKILDTNFEEYIEARGDLSALKEIKIPVKDRWEF